MVIFKRGDSFSEQALHSHQSVFHSTDPSDLYIFDKHPDTEGVDARYVQAQHLRYSVEVMNFLWLVLRSAEANASM